MSLRCLAWVRILTRLSTVTLVFHIQGKTSLCACRPLEGCDVTLRYLFHFHPNVRFGQSVHERLLPKMFAGHAHKKVGKFGLWIGCSSSRSVFSMPSENSHTPQLFSNFVVLQPELTMDYIQIFLSPIYIKHPIMTKWKHIFIIFYKSIKK